MAFCRQDVDNIVDKQKQRDGARYAVPFVCYLVTIQPRYT